MPEAIANGKGRVGKTTTSVNIAAILSSSMKTLAVDADPQGSLSWWFEQGEMPFEVSTEPDSDIEPQSKYLTLVRKETRLTEDDATRSLPV